MHHPPHNLPNSNETSTRRVADHALVPCAIEGRGYRALFIAQFIDFREANGSHTEGAGGCPPIPALGTNNSNVLSHG